MFKLKQHPSSPGDTFERKVRLSRTAMLFEDIWPRLWLVIGVAGLFLLVSLAGLWAHMGVLGHKIALGAFGLAMLAALVAAVRVRIPSREEAVRRIERRSGVPHRPASAYEDTLTLNSQDAATQAIWHTHKRRLADLVARLRVGRPAPRTDRRDPLALRGAMLLGVVVLLVLVGDSARDRVLAAFRFGPPVTAAEARLDAWVTPPPYTAKPPVLLADGARGGLMLAGADGKPVEVPERSVMIARSSGANAVRLEIDMKSEVGTIEKAGAEPAGSKENEVSEVRVVLRRSGVVRVMSGSSELARWTFNVIPDQAPRITMTRPPEISRRGSMKSFYKVEDDHGVVTAEARFERLKPDRGPKRTAWARSEIELKGPRQPYERAPTLHLRLPRPGAKDAETQSFHELAAHPRAGMASRLTLVAKDGAGNVGRSQTIEMAVPERRFSRALARAVIEQRRKLYEDTRYRTHVLSSLDALTLEPDTFIQDRQVYLGLRSAYHRLLRDKSRAGIKSVQEQLWHIALRIEDGRSLSEAERRLRDLQDQLSRALQDGASDEDIRRLMQELRQALNEYLQELQRQAQNMPDMDLDQLGQNQTMSQQDLERMLNQLENMMRQGSRDMAQEMLSQLRDLLDRLQSGRMQQGQMGQGGQQMMQMLDQLGEIIGRQQRLQDDTFGQQRGDQQGQQGQGQQGQQGQGQQGQGQQGQRGQGQGGGLGDRQGQLRDQLGRLQQGLRQFGQQSPGQFDGAGEAMENARRAIERGDLDTATREQGRALEQLRQGAQQLAEQMMQQMQRRFGMGPNTTDAPRDPLGRPQRSEGPDLGTTVKVPDEIDIQRAREILEELRRRLGDQSRPTFELDYIERLLRRF